MHGFSILQLPLSVTLQQQPGPERATCFLTEHNSQRDWTKDLKSHGRADNK